jgi:hypothetical protein
VGTKTGYGETMADGGGIVIGVLTAPDDRELAETLAEDLPPALRERVGDHVSWHAEVCEAEPADRAASRGELVDAVRRRLLDGGWEMGIGLTALPLRSGRRPVTAHASASHGVGLISIPALGAARRAARLREAAVQVVEGLLGEARDGDSASRGARMTQRSGELASPIAAALAEQDGTLRFTGAVVRGNLRLLAGMIRANRPTRVMSRLSRSATAALGTGAYALTSSNIWLLADRSSLLRLLAVGLLSIVLILVALVIAHGLWERARDVPARERVVLFNIVTITTLAIGVATLYVALFAVMTIAAAILISPATLAQEIGHGTTAGDIARLAWLAASVATVGGALGSLVESDGAVRDAAYRPRVDD